jgi:hypothetical protein
MHPTVYLTIFYTAVIALASPSEAGNKWMMDRARNELVMLNSEILESLNQVRQNGKVILKGSIVYRNGETILQIDKLQHFESEPEETRSDTRLFKEDEHYKIFLRTDTLQEIKMIDEAGPKP